MKPQDVTKKLGEMWKELKPEERLPFEELAQKAAARYAVSVFCCAMLLSCLRIVVR